MKKRIFYFAILTSLILSLTCNKDVCDPTPQFDIDLFIENVRNNLDQVAGYQLVVNRDGNLYDSFAEGFSIYDVDPGGPVAMTVNTRLNVASVSKFIGTIALMQVLEKHNIGIEQPIHSYLPGSWKTLVHPDHFDAGSNYKVRFKNLLSMETGIQFTGASNWSPGDMPTTLEMLSALILPADPSRWGVYQNGNFTLIRVLIGEIEYNLSASAPDYDLVCAETYFKYIKENIFDKLNLNPPMSVTDVNSYYLANFTRAHQWPFDDSFRDGNNNLGWGATSNPQNNGGSGGLVLSAMDLANVLAFFQHDQNSLIISETQRDLVLENELGLIESINGEHGRYQSKGGTRGPSSDSRALKSRIIFYPNGVEAVLLSNSNITGLGTILRKSFDDAWVPGC
jgi:CubicO group peptidase (beta-lactamase class C family)